MDGLNYVQLFNNNNKFGWFFVARLNSVAVNFLVSFLGAKKKEEEPARVE